MTLATRCSACGTIFRVVQDQLRVSQGWVRCGRCGEPFNALESMVDLPPPRLPLPAAAEPATAAVAATAPAAALVPSQGPAAPDAPPPAEPPAFPSDEPLAAPAAHTETAAAALPMIELPAGVELIASDGAVGDLADVPRTSAQTSAEIPAPPTLARASVDAAAPAALAGVVAASAATGDAAAPTPAVPVPAPAPAPAPTPAPAPAPAGSQVSAADVAPSFIVQAERAARWRHPGVRAALTLGVFFALLGLAAQFTYVFRDRVAATLPTLRPWLQQACAATIDCRVGDLRQIDALSVESSGLVRVEGSPVFRLSVTLRNRAAIEVAAPALDLALNDAQGRPIARRVLTMADLDLPLRTLKPGSELPIQVPLGIGDRQVSGYTVEIFYP